jgi:hypothetical protein
MKLNFTSAKSIGQNLQAAINQRFEHDKNQIQ